MNSYSDQKSLLRKNTISSFVFQATTIICGLIVPRLILKNYGSDVNGLVNSIKQFLSIISFLELGVGAVVQSSLYKPIAEKDEKKINEVLTSANHFFNSIGKIFIAYVILLVLIYPKFINENFTWFYTAALILAISISYFAQYFFGIVDRLFLNSAQHGYVQYNSQTVTLILNTVASYLLIKLHSSIQVFQLVSSIIYLARPIYIRYYLNKHYNLNRHVKYTEEPIDQKWNGIAQHVASIVLEGTDIIVLTIFSTLSNVSIYSVYNLVISGVKSLTQSLTSGVQALEGELWANEDYVHLKEFFSKTEWAIHMATVLVFTCTLILIVPFVQVYTIGINDANYIQPVFSTVITLAVAIQCLRLPYLLMVLAAGHYRQTQGSYIIAALLNVIISIIMVFKYGLIGVAIGTFISLLYQTIWLTIYTSKYLIEGVLHNTIKLYVVDVTCMILSVLICSFFKMPYISYVGWLLQAVPVFLITILVLLAINMIFYRKYVMAIMVKIFNKKDGNHWFK